MCPVSRQRLTRDGSVSDRNRSTRSWVSTWVSACGWNTSLTPYSSSRYRASSFVPEMSAFHCSGSISALSVSAPPCMSVYCSGRCTRYSAPTSRSRREMGEFDEHLHGAATPSVGVPLGRSGSGRGQGQNRCRPARREAALRHVLLRGVDGDDAVGPAVPEPDGAGPGVERAQPVAPADQVEDMDERPHGVGDEAGE